MADEKALRGGRQHGEGTADPARREVVRPGVRGILRLTRYGAGGPSAAATATATVHRTTFVNGPTYQGMSDNDIRGFLDGGYIWAWNQSTQIHVRLGRAGRFKRPKYAEVELFRALQRWGDIDLPRDSTVHACRLSLRVENGPARPLRLYLFAVRQDWNPGEGGVDGNNVSVPRPGEVWWRDAAFGDREWGLPGCGYASEAPDADTDVHALAECLWTPGEERLSFESDSLAAYAEDRIRNGRPLLFLLKLADALEDTPGCMFELYSAEAGDSWNPELRPALELEWSSAAEEQTEAFDLFLEHGRSCEIPIPTETEGEWAITFEAEPGYASPWIETRERAGDEAAPWRPAPAILRPSGTALELRASAAARTLPLGSPFEAEIRDTWMLTGPAESRSVRWVFESPTGAVHRLQADYVGRYRWRVSFVPEEPGAWRYRWRHDLLPEGFESPYGEFHVRAESLQTVLEALAVLEGTAAEVSASERGTLHRRLYALEREGMALLTPESYRSEPGRRFLDAMRGVRSALWGGEMPPAYAMESHDLIREVDGVPLVDPVPDSSRYDLTMNGSSDPANGLVAAGGRLRRVLRRVWRRTVGRR